MLCEDKITALFCLIDDLLKAIGHQEDCRVKVSDSEVITTALIAALYFSGHYDNARAFVSMTALMPSMLDKSRFCRRLHRRAELLETIFCQLVQHIKDITGAATYVLDSFPVAVCDNIRICRSRLLKGEQWRGKQCSMRRYFYGVKVQVVTLNGVPVECCLVAGSEADVRALSRLPLQLGQGSRLYCDAAYTNYKVADLLAEQEGIALKTSRKSHAKRKDQPWEVYLKEQIRKGIETTFSQIKARMPRSIHATSTEGFLLKTALFVRAFAFEQLLP
jgi:hypothetical protein